MLHLHRLTVILYFVLMLVLVIPLLINKRNLFVTFRAKAKWVRMTLEFLMLATGIYLLLKSPAGTSPALMVKYGLIILALLILVLGLRKYNYHFVMAGLLVWVYIYGISETRHALLKSPQKQTANLQDGEKLYNNLCLRCHGKDGDAGFAKAANLKTSTLSDTEIKAIIKNGKNMMPSFKYLSEKQIEELTKYVKQLRK